ncbi:hypothetical protein ABFU26_15185 [Xanthomonas campestris pv. raphani]|uniref:hypothetical protein n=1 Tax=Xanthomonas campestris TaxID=339 RepID=UPI0013053E7D|nr:hypothetical protein [Xanthomonas campestris]MEA9674820.1 hypothetical protein [Xanthomonas campestris pv. raphani]MEA9773539.1 hypothetical protein [Xanthomonas campestris pv. raphani]MEA9917883.1 hypothetical protein [Xanthomonas campestris pv. raphani]
MRVGNTGGSTIAVTGAQTGTLCGSPIAGIANIANTTLDHRDSLNLPHARLAGMRCVAVLPTARTMALALALAAATADSFPLLFRLLHLLLHLLLLLLPGPYRSGRRSGSNPIGAARMDARGFSKGQGRPFEKFPDGLRTWSAQRGRREDGVCFLLVTFLCTSKEQ